MNNETNKKISEALGIDPLPVTTKEVQTINLPTIATEDQTKLDVIRERPLEEIIIDEDFNEARENLKDLIRKQQDSIDTLTMIAAESESPRHFEVLAAMMKNLADMNDKLLNLSKQRKELTKGLPVARPTYGSSGVSTTHQNIENAVFVGSSSDLDDLLAQRRQTNIAPPLTITPNTSPDVVIPTNTVSDKEQPQG
jgi:hypothetical protein